MATIEQQQLTPYITKEKNDFRYPLTLWFDSSKEGQDFSRLLQLSKELFEERGLTPEIILRCSRKYVKHKTDYRKGIYWPLIDIERMLVLNQKFLAPSSIVKMSEWQHQDFIIANRYDPMFVVEVTEHILTYNNIAQRLPRLALPASYGVPSVIFQKIGAASKDKYKGWFLKTLCRSTEIFKRPCAAILYDDETRIAGEKLLAELTCQLINYICFNDKNSLKMFEEHLTRISEQNQAMAKQWYDHNSLLSSSWLDVDSNQVRVLIKVKAEDSMWQTKGTGGLDPYPGLVLLADLLLCRTGPNKSDRERKLVVVFEHLTEDFWWFKQFPNELYLQLLINPQRRIADKVVFKRG